MLGKAVGREYGIIRRKIFVGKIVILRVKKNILRYGVQRRRSRIKQTCSRAK